MSSGAQGSSGSAGPSTENAGRESSSPNPASQIEDFAHQHAPLDTSGSAPKKKKHRAGKKRRNRRQSFAAPSDQTDDTDLQDQRPTLHTVPEGSQAQSTFYRLGARAGRSNTSLESEALLDHRDQYSSRARRQSQSYVRQPVQSQSKMSSGSAELAGGFKNPKPRELHEDDSGDEMEASDRTPLILDSQRQKSGRSRAAYNAFTESPDNVRRGSRQRRRSGSSSLSNRRLKMPARQLSTNSITDYDVNNPPSIPGSPRLGSTADFGDVMLPEFDRIQPQQINRTFPGSQGRDTVIDIDHDATTDNSATSPRAPVAEMLGGHRKRQQSVQPTVEDVCLPFDQMTEIGEEDFLHRQGEEDPNRQRRSHKRPWPDLSALEEWSHDEKEERTIDGIRAKKVNDPVLVGGRLRPQKGAWQREDEEAPFRWTYFNEELDSSLRSHTISGLQQLGLSFRELFIPDCPEIDDELSDEDDDYHGSPDRTATPSNGQPRATTRQSSLLEPRGDKQSSSGEQTGRSTPSKPPPGEQKTKRLGPRPVFWLDVLQPTYDEMRVISRAFGIHKLTAEDIMEQEAREKVELFRNYYFVNYRTFEQDEKSEDYMDAVNMYFVVFKGGVISFHFSQMPHPANVRRRIRQLAEHQYTDSDWISYAIIDNITDAYAPLIEQIEREVDDIDDQILRLHDSEEKKKAQKSGSKAGDPEKMSVKPDSPLEKSDSGRNMLLRVGECRKKVMGLYRLLGNKADVIKGLAKRCNEQWQVAPRSDVGLYLGDIQDHIITMTGNLTHYESILSRAHSNYLAQISIKMNERAEQTSDVLGKLTVLGTIVLPMNIITGMWGMNILVPGQADDTLWWFWGLTLFLLVFGVSSFVTAKKVYGIV